MLEQNDLFRGQGLGNFDQLVKDVTVDPAMLVWLSGLDNRRGAINENYGRELMELFTLGADRGAYTETGRARDRPRAERLARGLERERRAAPTSAGTTAAGTTSPKTVFGQTGNFKWEDACRLVVEHPLHASFFVTQAVVVLHPDAAEQRAGRRARQRSTSTPAARSARCSRRSCASPELYAGRAHGQAARSSSRPGCCAITGRTITDDNWTWMGDDVGPAALLPARRLRLGRHAAGWTRSTMAGRWLIVNEALRGRTVTPSNTYPAETADRGGREGTRALGRPASDR